MSEVGCEESFSSICVKRKLIIGHFVNASSMPIDKMRSTKDVDSYNYYSALSLEAVLIISISQVEVASVCFSIIY